MLEPMRVFIVDDEPPIARYIAKCVQQAPGGHEVVGIAASGSKALTQIESCRLDLVFTDITMPKMDGLELLRVLKERYPELSVVMLTCHDDFAYARQAVQDQADDYILKSEISTDFMGKKLAELQKLRQKKHANQIVDWVRKTSYLSAITETGERRVQVLSQQELQANRIHLQEDAFLAIAFRNTVQNTELTLHRLPAEFTNFLLYSYNKVINILLCNVRTQSALGSQKEREQYINTFLKALEDRLEGFVGRSQVYCRLASLQAAIEQSVSMMEDKFYGGPPQDGMTAREAERTIQKTIITTAIRAGEQDIAGACGVIEDVLDFAGKHHPDSTRMIELLSQAIGQLSHTLAVELTDCTPFESSTSFSELRGRIKETLRLIRCRERQYSKPIRGAIEYLTAHYAEDLNLSAVAAHVFLNREYLSRQFKKEVGVNFSEYLMELRLRKALQLLRGTELRIGEIADAVGLPNVSYFTSAFKKQYHMTPTEVRKKRG